MITGPTEVTEEQLIERIKKLENYLAMTTAVFITLGKLIAEGKVHFDEEKSFKVIGLLLATQIDKAREYMHVYKPLQTTERMELDIIGDTIIQMTEMIAEVKRRKQ